MFQVLQDGKPCSTYNISGWDVDTFSSYRDAEVFAFHWAYPYPYCECIEMAPEMPLNTPVNYSMSEFPVMMEIREV